MDDPWADPIGSADKILKRIAARQAAEAARGEAYSRYQKLFSECLKASDPVGPLLDLSGHINSQSHAFWIDLVDFNQKRLQKAKGTDPSLRDLALVCVIDIFRAALAGDRPLADQRLKSLERVFPDGAFRSAFGAIMGFFCTWELDREFPATPHMTTEELAEALDGMDGFSRATVFRMLREDDGRITSEEPHGDGRWVRFRHGHHSSQLAILRTVREYFLKHPDFQLKNRPPQTRNRKSH
jgi:hypothetical protein